MIAIQQIDHVVLRTSRLAAMTAFYRDVLGCTICTENCPACSGRETLSQFPMQSTTKIHLSVECLIQTSF